MLSGCVTKPASPPSDPFSVLGTDASMYMVIPVKSHRQLLDLFAGRLRDGEALLRAFDRTDLLYGSVSGNGSLRMLVTGGFPRSGASLYFPASKGWKKTGAREAGSWYASTSMDAAVPISGMVLLSSPGGMDAFLGSLKSPVPAAFPPSFDAYASDAEADGRIGVYLAHTEFLASSILGSDISVPVRYAEIYATAPAVGASGTNLPYLLSARVVLQDVRTARAMSALLRVTTGSVVRLEGESVYIDSFPVPVEKLAEWAGKLYFY